MIKKKQTNILSLENNDPQKELEFEVAFQLSLSEKQRYTIMKKLNRQTIAMIKNNDDQKTPAIFSRP
jgi:hypothetical protein